MTMPLYPSWPDIAIRLILTMIAGAVIGINRDARGEAAGATILVALAASVAGRERSSNRATGIIAAYPEHADQNTLEQQLRTLARDADTLIDAMVARPDDLSEQQSA